MKRFIFVILAIWGVTFTLGFALKVDAKLEPFTNPPIDLSWMDSLDNPNFDEQKISDVIISRKSNLTEEMVFDNRRYIIKYKYDLNGDTLRIGKNCCIDFKDGQILNGVIIGNDTKIVFDNKPIFGSIKIQGSWIAPIIKSSLFVDNEKENVLIQLFNLSNDRIYNKITIEQGVFPVRARMLNDGILRPKSNTELELNGTILLLPNGYKSYQIMSIYGAENVYVHGKGQIKGDLYEHRYDEGNGSHEWGHGLTIRGCENILVEGITIKDCTGDACSVGAQAYGDLDKVALTGTPSVNVTLRNCRFESSRRQGLTITFASFVTVDGCVFEGIFKSFKGTSPGAGIDIEPDNNGTKEFERGSEVYHIDIKNSTFNNCRLGILSWKSSDENDTRWFRDLQVENCIFNRIEQECFKITGFDNVYIRNCKITNSKNKYCFNMCKNVDNI